MVNRFSVKHCNTYTTTAALKSWHLTSHQRNLTPLLLLLLLWYTHVHCDSITFGKVLVACGRNKHIIIVIVCNRLWTITIRRIHKRVWCKRRYFIRDNDKVFLRIWKRWFCRFEGRNSPVPASSHISGTFYTILHIMQIMQYYYSVCLLVAKTIYADGFKSSSLQAYALQQAVLCLHRYLPFNGCTVRRQL